MVDIVIIDRCALASSRRIAIRRLNLPDVDFVYLDNNATTKPDPLVVEAMLPYLTDHYANPSSAHRPGQHARAAVDEARGKLAALLGCRDREVTFTGTGTEASNTAIRGLFDRGGGGRVVTTTVEHDATRATLEALGGDVVEVAVDQEGRLDLDAFADALDGAALATVIWANNETGVITNVAAVAGLCRDRGVPLHVDATQAAGKIPVDLPALGCDAATVSPHKFHGPKGVGVLYLRRGVRIPPLVRGGPQERDRRGGTENVAGIVGSGVAAELAMQHLPEMERVRNLRDDMERRVVAACGDVTVNGGGAERLPNTSNLGFRSLQAEALLLMLSEAGVCASAGAACSSGSLEPSRVLRAMNVPEAVAFGSVRFSLSRLSTPADVDRLLEVLPPIVDRLRRVLPLR